MFLKRVDWKPVLLLLIFVTIVFYPLVFQGEVLFFGDNLSLRVPNAIYAASRMFEGELPLWNPYIFSGIPFFADVSTTVLHPVIVLFMLLDPLRALSLATLVHIYLAGVFAYFLGRTLSLSKLGSLMVSVVFMFSASMMHYTTYLNFLMSGTWLPLTFASFYKAIERQDRRWIGIGAFSLFAQILGGHPQLVFYTVLFMFFYVLFVIPEKSFKDVALKFIVVMFLAVGLSAVVLVPAYELTGYSTRSNLTYEEATRESLHPLLAVRLILANFFDNPKVGMTWGPAWRKVADNTGYGGALAIVLVGLALVWGKPFKAKKKGKLFKFFWLMAFGFLVMAFGKFTPLYTVIHRVLSILAPIRGPDKALLMVNFSLAVLAGMSLDSLRKVSINKSALRKVVLIVAGVFVSAYIILITINSRFDILWRRFSEFHSFERDQVIAREVVSNIMLLSLLIIFLLISIKKKVYWVILVLVFVDLMLFNSRYIFSIPRDAISLESNQASELSQEMSSQYRMLSYQDLEPFTGLGNYWENMAIKPPFAESFYTDEESEKLEILNQRLDDLTLDWNMTHRLRSPNGYASFVLKDYANYIAFENRAHLNNVNFQGVSEDKLDELSVRYLLTREGFEERDSALPRARLINQEGEVIGLADIVVDEPERIVVHTESEQQARLVLADSYYPGWRAFVDGKEVELEKYRSVFKLVSLEFGEHSVEFIFRPKSLYIGGLVSLLSVLGISAFLLKNKK